MARNEDQEEDEEEAREEGLSGSLLRHFKASYEKNREAMEELAKR